MSEGIAHPFLTRKKINIMTISNNINQNTCDTSSATQCPNCWGYSEWGGSAIQAQVLLDKVADRISRSRDGFIRKFVKQYL